MSDSYRLSLAGADDDVSSLLGPISQAIVEGEHREPVKSRSHDYRHDEIFDLATRVARLEAATKRKITEKDMYEFADILGGPVAKFLEQEVTPLRAQIKELEARSAACEWKGVWTEGVDNEPGNAVGTIIGETIEPLQKQIAALEAKSMAGVKWAGVWREGMKSAEGDLPTDRGRLWVCTAPTSDRPGENASAFRLIVKNGAHDGSRRAATGTQGVDHAGR